MYTLFNQIILELGNFIDPDGHAHPHQSPPQGQSHTQAPREGACALQSSQPPEDLQKNGEIILHVHACSI
jgi:hypothetical protein